MAKGRMLQKRISNSRKMANLSSDTTRLLYTWMLSHLDINGCFYADPVMVNNIVMTRLLKPIKVIEACLDELEREGLIIRYESDGERYLSYPDFEEKQPSLQPTKEGKPDIPPPTLEQLQSNSRVTPDQLHHNIKESKVKEEKIKHLDSVFLTEGELKKLHDLHGELLTNDAIEILNAYIMSSGKKYKSHYHTLIQWPIDKAREKQGQPVQGGNNGSRYPNRNRIPEPITRETQEGIDRINRMARELAQRQALDKAKADA